MKKLFTVLFVLIAGLCLAFAFTACDLFGGSSDTGGTSDTENTGNSGNEGNAGNSTDKEHIHTYVWKVDDPSQSGDISATGTCSCGDTQTMTFPALTDSRYTKTNDTATCGTSGIIKYSIQLDGKSYSFTVVTPATGLHNYFNGECTVCHTPDPDYVPHTHIYVDKSDETGHWQECECGSRSTVVPHNFVVAYDDEYHWSVCTVKGEIIEKELHNFIDGKCACGAEEYIDPNGVKAITVQHNNGDGKYLWNESDVTAGEYNFYDVTLEITHNDDSVTYEPITVDMLGESLNLGAGIHDVTVTYGGLSTELSVFVAPDDGYIEAVVGKSEITGYSDTLMVNFNDPEDFNNSGLNIEGMFNVSYNGVTYSGYYGSTLVNQRFLQEYDTSVVGLQECKIVSGNMSDSPAVLADINIMSYSDYVSEERVFVSDIIVRKSAGNSLVNHIQLVPGKPYVDLWDVTNGESYFEVDFYAEFQFAKGNFTEYSGGTDTAVYVDNIVPFDPAVNGYRVSGDIDVESVLWSGERLIRLASNTDEMTVPYTVYNSENTNIRFCRVHNDPVLNYEITDDFTLDSIKADLLKRNLYVEYFTKVNDKYVHIVPIEESMLSFDKVDVTSYKKQTGYIQFADKLVAINIIRPYTLTGASVLYTLNNTNGLNFILSDATVNDLGQCMNDLCKEIVLYDNDVAVMKHTGNDIGDVLIGYELNGNKLTLLRHGIACAFLTVNLTENTFAEIDLKTATAGMESTVYTFTHMYFPDTESYVGWTGTFTAYKGDTGYDYCWYVNVHLTGWASTVNGEGYAYQIAGVEYVASWTFGWHNNAYAFVLRLSDYDWWFEIGTADDSGQYRLTFVQKVVAS